MVLILIIRIQYTVISENIFVPYFLIVGTCNNFCDNFMFIFHLAFWFHSCQRNSLSQHTTAGRSADHQQFMKQYISKNYMLFLLNIYNECDSICDSFTDRPDVCGFWKRFVKQAEMFLKGLNLDPSCLIGLINSKIKVLLGDVCEKS